MRVYEVERGQKKRKNKPLPKERTEFERNVSTLNTKRHSLDAEKPVKPIKPS